MTLRTVYNSGMFDVFYEQQHIVHQPFRPTPQGTQEPFDSEQQAMAWWDTVKAAYEQTYLTDTTNKDQQNG